MHNGKRNKHRHTHTHTHPHTPINTHTHKDTHNWEKVKETVRNVSFSVVEIFIKHCGLSTLNPNTFSCCHGQRFGIFYAASTFIPCQDHNFVSAATVQLKTIFGFVWRSEACCLPLCQLIRLPVVNGVSSYRAGIIWRGFPRKSYITTLTLGWYFKWSRYT